MDANPTNESALGAGTNRPGRGNAIPTSSDYEAGRGAVQAEADLAPMLAAALAYAAEGVPVFPCIPESKKPYTAHGFHDASTAPEIIRRWWAKWPAAMIGMPTGAASGRDVLDVDMDEAQGKDGEATLAALVAKHGHLPDTQEVLTPRGGRHVYFLADPTRPLGCSTSKIGADLDIRGTGGYSILPPSHRADGKAYEWELSSHPDEAPLAPMPEWLRALAEGPHHGPSTGLRATPGRDTVVTDAQIEELRDALKVLDADPYDTWINMGQALCELGAVGFGLWDEWGQTSGKYDAAVARQKWGTFDGDRTGYQAVFSYAQRAGWVNPMAGGGQAPDNDDAGAKEPRSGPEEEPLPKPLADLGNGATGFLAPNWDPLRILGALRHLSPSDYKDMVVKAVHQASGGGLEGLDLVVQWASMWGGAPNPWQMSALENSWLALDPKKHKPITLRSVFKEAKEMGWDGGPYKDPPAPLRQVPLVGYAQQAPITGQYALAPLLPAGHVTLLGAHGGAGKSIVALTVAAHVACGQSWAGFPVQQGAALYVSLEDGGALVADRLRRITTAYALDPMRVMADLTIMDGTQGDGALAVEYAAYGVRHVHKTTLLDQVRDAAKGKTLVVVDNASDAYCGDENNRAHVRGFLRMLATIARDSGAAVLLLAHVDKASAKFGSQGNSYSGSTAWHNSARSRLALTGTDGVVEMAQEKLNLGKRADPVKLAWNDEGVLVPAGDAAIGDQVAANLQDGADDQAVLAAIKASIQAGVVVPTATAGRRTTFHVLESDLPPGLRTRDGEKRFWSALARLERKGDILREAHRDSSRNKSEKFIRRHSSIPPHTPPCNSRRGCVNAEGASNADI